MPSFSKRWRIATRLPDDVNQDLHQYPPLIRQILNNRGCTTAQSAHDYLKAIFTANTDALGITGIPEATDRILYALGRNEPIAIYGDYDADGVTATALLTDALRRLGADVQSYIPNRFDEGYGLNKDALETLKNRGIKLVITVDCGIRSLDEAVFASQLGLDLIITDHHHPASELPLARAVINPKQAADTYPDKDLAGVGLAYKLGDAVVQRYSQASGAPPSICIENYLDLVAIGTVADLAPLVGENRALVRAGLSLLRKPRRQGVVSLILAAGLKPQTITSTDIGFMLGPRLNAAGRLDSALAALELLTSDDPHVTGLLAQKLDDQNRERQKRTQEIQEQAEQMALRESPEATLLVAVHPDFNRGIVGLAASRLTERYYRPSMVAEQGPDYTRGSCRSIPEFHITRALDQCADLLVRYGGHAAAAGFTVANQNLPELIERMQIFASEQLANRDLRPTLEADAELPLSDLKPELLSYLDQLQPTGSGNHQAVFVSRNLNINRARTVGKDNSHLKLVVSDDKRILFDAIAFRQGHWLNHLPATVDLMYTFEVNTFNERSTLQLNVIDLKPAGVNDDQMSLN